MKNIAEKNGVEIYTNAPVKKIITEKKKVTGIMLESGKHIHSNIVVSNADMRFTETHMLDKEEQTYPESYWKKKTLAPSAYILYLGVDGKLPMLTHHNLIFTQDWKKNFDEIFEKKILPTDPSMYICKSSETDDSVAPVGKENMFVLVPCAPGVVLTEQEEEIYTAKVLDMIADVCHIPDLKSRIEFKRLFHMKHFSERYNAYK